MNREQLVHALSLLPRAESVAVLLDADRARDDMADRVLAAADAKIGIVYAVSAAYRVEPDALLGRSRCASICAARNTLAVLLSDLLDMSTPEIGRYLGGRDHSTVISGMRRGRQDAGPSATRARMLAVDALLAREDEL